VADTIASKLRAELVSLLSGAFDLDTLAYQLALKHHQSCPFSDELLKEGRARLLRIAVGKSEVEGNLRRGSLFCS